jgi:hypothetical protein
MPAKPTETPGLIYAKRKSGQLVPLWRAPKAAIKAGFSIKTWNLSDCPPADLPARCQRIWAEAMEFAGKNRAPLSYDGTVRSLLQLYQLHKESPYQKLKPTTLRTYDFYIGKLMTAYGNRRVVNISGLDVLRWNEDWRGPEQHLAAAAMATAILKAALGFGQLCGYADCKHLREVLSVLRLPGPKPRDQAPTAADVVRAMVAAIELGQPSAALCYALQFETAARQYDVAGQWVPIDDPRISPLSRQGVRGIVQKWIGPTWAAISADLILTLTPGKTERTTGRRVHVDLKLCPLVVEAVASIPIAARIGPLVVDARTGQPFLVRSFLKLWAEVRRRAGLPKSLWNRDLRAGALTEGGMAGATADDRAKLAGHSPKMTRQVYDRDVLVSANRVAEARAKFRKGE